MTDLDLPSPVECVVRPSPWFFAPWVGFVVLGVIITVMGSASLVVMVQQAERTRMLTAELAEHRRFVHASHARLGRTLDRNATIIRRNGRLMIGMARHDGYTPDEIQALFLTPLPDDPAIPFEPEPAP